MDARCAAVMMFSGLGSQTSQMGRDLFERNETFRAWMLHLDEISGPIVGHSVLSCLYGAPRDDGQPLQALGDSGIAIYMVELATAWTLRASGIEPDCVLAVSMGFFAAATVAGCMEPEEAITVLTVQARAFEAHCPKGGMLAILAPVALYQDPCVAPFCEVAAVNSPSHFVVAADEEGLRIVENYLRERKVPYQRLLGGYGFHSHWIDGARLPLEKLSLAVSGRRPTRIPIVCCARADRLVQLTPDCFWRIARDPIRLHDTIALLEDQGPNFYIDAGPSGSLATVLKGALPPHSRSLVLPTLTPFHNDAGNLEKIIAMKKRLQAGVPPGGAHPTVSLQNSPSDIM
jgi:bacillaene synthase trans-acting acyltransferase